MSAVESASVSAPSPAPAYADPSTSVAGAAAAAAGSGAGPSPTAYTAQPNGTAGPSMYQQPQVPATPAGNGMNPGSSVNGGGYPGLPMAYSQFQQHQHQPLPSQSQQFHQAQQAQAQMSSTGQGPGSGAGLHQPQRFFGRSHSGHRGQQHQPQHLQHQHQPQQSQQQQQYPQFSPTNDTFHPHIPHTPSHQPPLLQPSSQSPYTPHRYPDQQYAQQQHYGWSGAAGGAAGGGPYYPSPGGYPQMGGPGPATLQNGYGQNGYGYSEQYGRSGPGALQGQAQGQGQGYAGGPSGGYGPGGHFGYDGRSGPGAPTEGDQLDRDQFQSQQPNQQQAGSSQFTPAQPPPPVEYPYPAPTLPNGAPHLMYPQQYFPPNHPYAYGAGAGPGVGMGMGFAGGAGAGNAGAYPPYPPGPPLRGGQGYGSYGFGEGYMPPPLPSAVGGVNGNASANANGAHSMPQPPPPPPQVGSKGLNPAAQGFTFVPHNQPPPPSAAPPQPIAAPPPPQLPPSDPSRASLDSSQPPSQPQSLPGRTGPAPIPVFASIRRSSIPTAPPDPPQLQQPPQPNLPNGVAASGGSTASRLMPLVVVDGEKLKGIGGRRDSADGYADRKPEPPVLAGDDALGLSQSGNEEQPKRDAAASASGPAETLSPATQNAEAASSAPTAVDPAHATSTSAPAPANPAAPASSESIKTPRAAAAELDRQPASVSGSTPTSLEQSPTPSLPDLASGTWQFVGPSVSGYMSPPASASARQPSFAQAIAQSQSQSLGQIQNQPQIPTIEAAVAATGSKGVSSTSTSTQTQPTAPSSASATTASTSSRNTSTSSKKPRIKMDGPIRFVPRKSESSQPGENAYSLSLQKAVPKGTEVLVLPESESGSSGTSQRRMVRERDAGQRKRAVFTSGQDVPAGRRGTGNRLKFGELDSIELAQEEAAGGGEGRNKGPTASAPPAAVSSDASIEREGADRPIPTTQSTTATAPVTPAAQPKPKPASWAALVGAKPSSSSATSNAAAAAGVPAPSVTVTPTTSAGPSKLPSPTRSIASLPPAEDGPSTRLPASPAAPAQSGKRPAFNYAAAAAVGAALSPADELVKILSEGLARPQGGSAAGGMGQRQGTIPRGLINTGNMCFINTILQTLAYCPPFTDLLETLGQRLKADLSRKTPLLEAMIVFLREFQPGANGLMGANGSGTSTPTRSELGVVNGALPSRGMSRAQTGPAVFQQGRGSAGRDAFVPENVYDAMKENKRFDSMRRGFQEDAEEYLGFFLNTLHEELLHLLSRTHTRSASDSRTFPSNQPNGDREHSIERPLSPSAQQDNANGGGSGGGGDGWLEVGKKQRTHVVRSAETRESAITRIFGGTLRSILHIPGSKDSITLEPYQPLQLDITDPSVRSLTDALRGISLPETVQTWSSAKKENVDATKTVYVESWPPVLMCHLKRFVYDAEEREVVKKARAVAYGTELVIPNEIISPAKRSSVPVKYKLFSVVYHHGSTAGGGHYTVAVARQDGQQWIHFDDELVQPVPTDQVIVSAEEAASAAEGGRQGMIGGREKCAYLLFYQRIRA